MNGIQDPELNGYRAALEANSRDASSLTRNLELVQMNWTPTEGSWSLSLCLRHLISTTNAYIPQIDRAIDAGFRRKLHGEGPFRHGWFINRFIRALEPPPTKKMWGPKIFSPDLTDVEDVVSGFDVSQTELISRAQAADGLHLSRVRVASPASNFLWMSLGQAFGILAAHQRRHLWQAHEIRRHPEFPDSAARRTLTKEYE
ncbi:MAG: DinB family protein [Gemmatimonadota bacterium]|nr:DinB family protein [Gemmatimonadota bacterium]MDH5804197.1 DinB family protein [Gemmatimonadota bacterium]